MILTLFFSAFLIIFLSTLTFNGKIINLTFESMAKFNTLYLSPTTKISREDKLKVDSIVLLCKPAIKISPLIKSSHLTITLASSVSIILSIVVFTISLLPLIKYLAISFNVTYPVNFFLSSISGIAVKFCFCITLKASLIDSSSKI